MRVNKQRRHRKTLRFYTACHGFRSPFKILCDGTFVHHLIANRIVPADTALMKILGAPVKIFTTRCALVELRTLGASYSDSYDAACNLVTARCDHEKRKSAKACIEEVIGAKNLEHFFVATQDAELRKKLQEIPGVPLIYGLQNALFLERPSALQHKYAKTDESERSHMTDLDYKILKLKKHRMVSVDSKDSADEGEEKIEHSLVSEDSKKKPKRKKAKGPNPLSCKKKKVRAASEAAPAKSQDGNASESRRSRGRKRKRTRKTGNNSQTTAT